MLRDAARDIYRRLPGKGPAFSVLRKVWTPPESVWRHLWFEGFFETSFEGKPVKLYHSGTMMENAVFWRGFEGPWEGYSLKLFGAAARQSKFVVDVGAHAGIYSLIAQVANPSARVMAFEPNRAFTTSFKNSVQANRFNIEIVEAGLSDHDGEVHFSGFEVVEAGSAKAKQKVQVLRLDNLLAGREDWTGLDLMKIDVERHEPEVLRGCGELLEAHRPSILVEILDDEVGALIEPLMPTDYAFFAVDDAERSLTRVSSVRRYRDRNLFLCTEGVARSLNLPVAP